MGAERGGARELKQFSVGEGSRATSSARFLNYSLAERVTWYLTPRLPLPPHHAEKVPQELRNRGLLPAGVVGCNLWQQAQPKPRCGTELSNSCLGREGT